MRKPKRKKAKIKLIKRVYFIKKARTIIDDVFAKYSYVKILPANLTNKKQG